MVQNKRTTASPLPAARKPRGRPRSFISDDALTQVLQTFWAKGYSGTSLDDLASATGLNRPSLYAAFGNKRALYGTVLQRYWQLSYDRLSKALSNEGSLQDALIRVYEHALTMYFPANEISRGCFAIGTAVTEAVEDPGIRQVLAAGLQTIDQELERRILAARDAGEISAAADCHALAMLASATLHSIAIRARAGESREALSEFGRNAARLICNT